MTNGSRITRINPDDPRVTSAAGAERRLFEHYGLAFTVHHVELKQPKIRVRVLEAGSGPPVVMVPGGSGDAVWFIPLMAHLTGWRLIAVNRPGGGMSDGVDHRQVDVRHLAVETLVTVLDVFGLKRVPVIGNSMGGLWTFWLALDRPERVSMMVQLGCPALILNTSAPFFMRLMTVPIVDRVIVRAMQPQNSKKAHDGLRFMGTRQEVIDAMPDVSAEAAYHFFHLPTYVETWLSIIKAAATLRGAKPRYQLRVEQLRRIRQPVLFIWGDNDPFGSLDVARQATSLVPEARLHTLAAGHLPFVDNPAECGRVIRDFLATAKSM